MLADGRPPVAPTDTEAGWIVATFDCLDELIRSLPVPDAHRELLDVHVREGRRQATRHELPPIHLSINVHRAIAGVPPPPVLPAACALIYLGADLLDNVADAELPAAWAARGPAEANLAAATLLAAVPHFAVEALRREAGPSAASALRAMFAETLLSMSAGQFLATHAMRNTDITPDQVLRVDELLAAAPFACYAQAGAVVAGGHNSLREDYRDFGFALGAGAQVLSDLDELRGPPPVQDLLTAKATLPLAHVLTALDPAGRDRLRLLIAAAQRGPDAHPELQALVASAGSIDYAAEVVAAYRRRALAALERSGATGEGAARLKAIAEELPLG